MNSSSEKTRSTSNLIGDFFGGTAAMLVALPSAIAFGLIIYAPLGPEFSGRAAVGGIMGTIALGLLAPLFGGTKCLVSAPCAPAAAVLAVFVAELISKGSIPPALVPVYIAIVTLCTGVIQIILGRIGGGKFIKYIPYPVVAGYLSGVGVIIFTGQVPKLLGLPKDIKFIQGFSMSSNWQWESILIGLVTIVVMFIAPRIIKTIPAAIIALMAGIICYFSITPLKPSLLELDHNPFVIGPISASMSELGAIFTNQFSQISSLDFNHLGLITVPVLTLAVLLSIDTLKTCVVLDAITFTRHDSNKELFGQGIGNIGAALLCGIPGAGTMGATLVNLNSGAKTKMSGTIAGFTALLVLLLFGKLVAWIPISALAGILIVVAIRMVDFHSFTLLKHRSTTFDFMVILCVVITAISASLIAASGVGIAMAIILFLREQMRTSVIRRKVFGNQIFSKKTRITAEREILEKEGKHTIIVELQGQLFFGTADQLLTEIEPALANSKYVLLDMRRVQSVDYTAVNRIKQILGRIRERNGFLIFTSVPLSLPSGQNVKAYIGQLGLAETENLKFFDDLDFALEWVEDQILKEARVQDDQRMMGIKEIDILSAIPDELMPSLMPILQEKSYHQDERVFSINEEGDEVYFIRKGTVKIVLPLAGGSVHHLVTITKGGVFGDMAFLDRRKRSADAVAENDVVLYVLSRDKFDEAGQTNPEMCGVFFEKLAFLISNRLRLSDMELKALQEN